MARLNSENFSRSRKSGNIIFWLNFVDRTPRDLQNWPDFFEFFWIFSNKIVFEMVFYFALKVVRRSKDTLYIFRILLTYCIFCTISPRLGELGKGGFIPKTVRKFDFTRVKIAWVNSKSNKPTLKSIPKSPDN